MDSEDDVYEENDVESVEDYYSGEETAMDSDDCDGGYSDGGEDEQGYMDDSIDSSIDTTSRCQRNYTVLSEDDVRRHQEEAITRISHELFISKVSAVVLLRHYDWGVGKLHDDWFTDEEKVRATVGLLERPVVHYPSDKELTCRICFDNYRRNMMYSAACGHPFCGTCWKSYISISIQDGPGCLALRCPDPSCCAAIDQDMVNMLVCDEDKQKYSRYVRRSYVEASKKTKWCPAPGCDYAIDFVIGSGSYDVCCNCTYGFCWNCTEEAHRPVNCVTVSKWILKNSAESENTNWILANSKPCPKCKRYIEKNQGCMHMTCTAPCNFEFCWLCLGSWKEHGEKTGGYYACNIYETAKQQGTFDETEKIREMAKSALERYTHYYERWAANESSRKKAFADFQQMQTVHMEKLIKIQSESEFQLKFITDAWLQIIECRRVLKWTYAYGYYLPEHELAKKQLFEYLQGEAESWLERLHQCTEKDLQVHLNAEKRSEDFTEFRIKLLDMTIVTRNFFDNLVRALENDLADDEGACSETSSGTPLSTDETERRPSGGAATMVAVRLGNLMDEVEQEY